MITSPKRRRSCWKRTSTACPLSKTVASSAPSAEPTSVRRSSAHSKKVMVMIQKIDIAPARVVLENAVAVNDQLGHENLGSLSYSFCFLPRSEPLKVLPSSHKAWDEIANAIPA